MQALSVRILIADDHPVVRQGLRQFLSQHRRLTVAGEAKDGNETLVLARKIEWDVAVLDYAMPGRSGLDLITQLKQEFSGRPILVLSMYPEDVHAKRVLRAGAAGYINKETAGEELVGAIMKVADGGTFVSKSLAEKLAYELAPTAERPPHEMLSDREYRVLWLLASGKPINEIAEEMFLSPSTISTYRARTLTKLGLSTNADLIHYAIKHHLIESPVPSAVHHGSARQQT